MKKKLVHLIIASALCAALAAAFTGCAAGAAGQAESNGAKTEANEMTNATEDRTLTPEEAKARMDSGDEVIILDVRTCTEYNEKHIPNAILIPNEEIGAEPPAQLPDMSAEILVYCRSGRRSAEAASKLEKLGYTAVYDFGGINDWPYETVSEK